MKKSVIGLTPCLQQRLSSINQSNLRSFPLQKTQTHMLDRGVDMVVSQPLDPLTSEKERRRRTTLDGVLTKMNGFGCQEWTTMLVDFEHYAVYASIQKEGAEKKTGEEKGRRNNKTKNGASGEVNAPNSS